ncbi:hypothetical protein NDR87_35805 [Nocardia sp. CDC159]|uniref:Uncharacterized protein n=1 Tax=Nocardia pulmonis TaxID=2951408 RepID=A0A9X2J0R8_9NOCA|nr:MULTISPECIES: hypothetical protein [Nocardia]MCM6778853.1 hypothetical protein [Nocardia pulmonis]MCM6791742.1 hypothetical protein [Nocardia sp. CDC159]
MARTMYDSDTAKAIPADATMVAGYVDGRPKWSQADWDLFPNATKVGIAVDPRTDNGEVLDVEPGAAEPEQAPGWIRMRQAAGLQRPTIYCSKSSIPAVRTACEGLTYALWVADPTGVEHGFEGAVACQWAQPGHGSPGHYDISLVTDDNWPGPGVPPAKAHFAATGDNHVALVQHPSDKNRLDALVITPDNTVVQFISRNGFQGLVSGAPSVNWGEPGGEDPVAGSLSATWDADGKNLEVTVVVRRDNRVLARVVDVDGRVVWDWVALPNMRAKIPLLGSPS